MVNITLRAHTIRISRLSSKLVHIVCVFYWRSEALLRCQFWARPNVRQIFGVGGGAQVAGHHVVNIIIRDQVMGYALNSDAHGLLDKSIRFETVRVYKTADKLSLCVSWLAAVRI